MALVRTHYPDFGPTPASEQLAERHDLHVGLSLLFEGSLQRRPQFVPSALDIGINN